MVQPEAFDPRGGGENVILVIGVSTKYALYSEPFVKLPFANQEHPVTKLKKDCAAIIGWYDAISIPDDVRFWAGDVPADLMIQINALVRADIAQRIAREFKSITEVLPLLFPPGDA